MAVYGSNLFQWEPTMRVVKTNGNVIHIQTVRYRHKELIIGVLGVTLGNWSDWYWENPDEQTFRLTDGTLCDPLGNPI